MPSWLLASMSVMALASAAGSAAALDGDVLWPGVAVARDLAAGETHVYTFSLAAGDLLEAVVHPQGVDVALMLSDTEGVALAKLDNSVNPMWVERVLWIARVGGIHSLAIRAKPDRPGGRYEVALSVPRPALAHDQRRVSAQRDLEQVLRWRGAGTVGTPAVHPEARRRLESALETFRVAGDRQGEANVLDETAELELILNRRLEALTLAEQALMLNREVGDVAAQGWSLQKIGWARFHRGDMEGALDAYRDAVALARKSRNAWAESTYSNDVGTIHRRNGDAEKAIHWYEQAITKSQEGGNRELESFALNNLGIAYKDLGEYERALSAYEQAVQVHQELNDARGEAGTYNNMGNVYKLLGDPGRARDFYRRYLDHALKHNPGGGNEARALNNLSGVSHELGDYAEALEQGRRSLAIRRTIGDVSGQAATLQTMGQSLHKSGRSEEALEALGKALRIRRELGERYLEADALMEIAVIERDRGRLGDALRQAEAALNLTEELRAAVTSPDLRASFVAAQQDKYGLYIDVLMRLHQQDPAAGYDAAALEGSERAKARVLLDTLIEARADIRQGVDPDLLARERALQRDIHDASARLASLLSRGGAPEPITQARRELTSRAEEYRQVQSRIRQDSPRYAALTQPVPATVAQMRRDLLDDDTVLLAFHLGEERSFRWALTRSELVSEVLPARARIEAVARKVHDLLSGGQRALADPAASERHRDAACVELSRLLFGGLAVRLTEDWRTRRLLVVASGALAYLPLSALPAPSRGLGRPLLRDHEVVFAPSASVVIAMRQEQARSGRTRASVAVLADPVFEAGDPRVRGGPNEARARRAAPVSRGLLRAMDSLGTNTFTRLPFSRREADAIAARVPPSSMLRATDFAANRALVTGGALGERAIVHFATHGLLDSQHPDLSGLVLSLVDEDGTAQDGFLRMHDVYNLALTADLVVLSACQTALGREIRGEGLIGLTRGFMYAGAKAVVASLWQVDDESTAELMKRFYGGMVTEKRRPADALRTAQLEMSRTRRWSAPFHWAGFVLQGEWR